ncbi:NAD-dependent epimerase/dehydratase family protein [Microbacterium sp. NPDC058389]|uniref:NAD-dependent epimerase/dehydratase family protein n=1 Tax=Microbacterium sp. NPDC058389 TaxID=3346475 RepID=UPI003658B8E0
MARAREDIAFRADVDWSSPERAVHDLRAALETFAREAEGSACEIYWCAGRGVTSTPREKLDEEVAVFRAFLADVEAVLGSRADDTRLFLASSVGGAYAGSDAPPFTEATPPRPLSAYGDAKLEMESALAALSRRSGIRSFIARITNLYGPGQDLAKGQGLISVLVESSVTGRPVAIYVPLDTLRDYIYVDDCARVIDAGMLRLSAQPAGTSVVKIVGSMNALSIGAIIAELSRIRRKRVPIVIGQGSSAGQASDLRVRSEVWTDLDGLVSTTVPAGLGTLYRVHLAAHMVSG